MEITHRTNNLRIAPRKLREVADKVRYQKVGAALSILPLLDRKGATLIYKSLKSALQMAEDHNVSPEKLVIQRIWCDEGPAYKRAISRSHGMRSPIMKKMSHLSIVLKGEELAKRRQKAKATDQPAETPEGEKE